MSRILAADNPEDVYKDDYHGHPNYIKVFITLIIIMGITLIPDVIKMVTGANKTAIMIAGIFVFSSIKAGMVMSNFMHLKFEPRALWALVGFALFCLIAFFVGVMPDTTFFFDPNTHSQIGEGFKLPENATKAFYDVIHKK
ncbi:MAG: cytochrome C oxidase subunit IV family protein [Spirochaetota bacterium]|nr:cytochrome C oxidase subunit IV family protein [Spirochaetota bacterium]